MSGRTSEVPWNALRLAQLENAKEHLAKAADYVEYAMTNGQANVQADGLVTADSAIASANEHLAKAKEFIQGATSAL